MLLFGEAEGFEEALLNILAMDSNAAGAKLVAVEDEVVSFGAHFPGGGLKFFQVFIDDAGEGMLRAHPGFVGLAPFEQRKACEPQEFPLGPVDHAECFTKVNT